MSEPSLEAIQYPRFQKWEATESWWVWRYQPTDAIFVGAC